MRGLHLWHLKRQSWLRYPLWSCLAAIVVLSLLPGDARPHTGAPGELEHFVAYLGTGLFGAARYRSPRGRLTFWVAIMALSFALEAFQQFVPGRVPDVFDALASSSGVTLGVLCGAALIAAVRSKQPLFFDAAELTD
jgi:VanZ family protein